MTSKKPIGADAQGGAVERDMRPLDLRLVLGVRNRLKGALGLIALKAVLAGAAGVATGTMAEHGFHRLTGMYHDASGALVDPNAKVEADPDPDKGLLGTIKDKIDKTKETADALQDEAKLQELLWQKLKAMEETRATFEKADDVIFYGTTFLVGGLLEALVAFRALALLLSRKNPAYKGLVKVLYDLEHQMNEILRLMPRGQREGAFRGNDNTVNSLFSVARDQMLEAKGRLAGLKEDSKADDNIEKAFAMLDFQLDKIEKALQQSATAPMPALDDDDLD